MIRNISIIVVLALIALSCKFGGDKGLEGLEVSDSILNQGQLQISEESMNDIIENISSPVEMAALIKSLGVEFSKDYLTPTTNVSRLNTSFRQAFSLGIYGADLGYLNMYNKTSTVLDYISVIKDLADGIKVGQFFDFSTLKRLATNNSNLDSLMDLSVRSFNQMDSYLRDNNRGNLSTLIITGVWIEGLYLATQVASKSPHPNLRERIGEQKLTLEKLLILLRNYKADPQFAQLISLFDELNALYKDISITIELGEPEAIEQDGMMVIIQHDKSTVNITDAQLNNIIAKTEEVRNKMLQL